MRFRPRAYRDEPEINFIPLIDVLLVILIFLMVTTTYQRVAELQITLPEADAEQMKQRPKEINVAPEFLAWLTDPARNGAGALFDFGCYGADLLTWLMNGEAPATVTAVTQQIKPEIYPRVDDEATIILAYPKAQAILQASWNWPFDRKDMEVYGETGEAITVHHDDLRVRRNGDDEERQQSAPALTSPYNDSISYLIAVVSGEIEPTGLSALDTNVIVVRILDAARESARTGRTIRIADR